MESISVEGNGWIFFALFAAIAQAGLALVNEYFKVNPVRMLLWMRALLMTFLFPVVFAVNWPTDPLYYIFVFIGAMIFACSDIIRFGVAAKSGAGQVTRIEPLAVGITFVVWTLISPSLLVSYWEEPLRACGILLSLGGCLYFSLRMRRCRLSREAFSQMMPVLLLSAAGVIIGKYAMMHSPFVSGVLGYAFLQSLIVFLIYIIVLNIPALARNVPHQDMVSGLRDKKVLIAGVAMALAWLLHTPPKWAAISLVENPAYVTMIGLSAPFWVLLIYRLVGRREKSDIYSGLGVVVSTALLIAFVQI